MLEWLLELAATIPFKATIASLYVLLSAVNGCLLVYRTKGDLKNWKTWSPLRQYYFVCMVSVTAFLLLASAVQSTCGIPGSFVMGTCRASYALNTIPGVVMIVAFTYSTIYAYERLSGVLVGIYYSS